MFTPNVAVLIFSIGILIFRAEMLLAQDYPNRPIRIVASEPGSGNDLVARVIAPDLTNTFGRQVIVDNRGQRSVEIVWKAPPDGYTILISSGSLWLKPFLSDHVSYDPLRDFSPITLAVRTPNILVVHPSFPVKSVVDLIALAKAKPGELNYSASGKGASPHLAAELFKAMAGLNIVFVPYKGSAAALNSVIGGQVQLMFPNAGSVTSHIKSGRLRALAVTSAQPSVLAPGLPTVAASGLPGYESTSMSGIFAPAKTPPALINRLNQEIVRLLNKTDVKERLFNSGVETVGSSPEQFVTTIKSEIVVWGKLIKDTGIRGE